jgi:hypothetical protein
MRHNIPRGEEVQAAQMSNTGHEQQRWFRHSLIRRIANIVVWPFPGVRTAVLMVFWMAVSGQGSGICGWCGWRAAVSRAIECAESLVSICNLRAGAVLKIADEAASRNGTSEEIDCVETAFLFRERRAVRVV